MHRSDEEVAALESAIKRNPSSERARADLLEVLSANEERFDDQRRVELIGWFLDHNPRHYILLTPCAHVGPAGYRGLKVRWLALVNESPADPQLARAAAAFVAAHERDEAKAILRGALDCTPDDGELWLDLARMSENPSERLAAYEKARAYGNAHPNLLVWTGRAAIEAGDHVRAGLIARELMQSVDEARARLGDKVNWPDEGNAFWVRARAASGSAEDARRLVHDVSQHAYEKHWGHTLLGLLACRQHELERATAHLAASADVRPDYRLKGYGPALDLLRELCAQGRWEAGLSYLRKWEEMWEDPRVLKWIAAVKTRNLP